MIQKRYTDKEKLIADPDELKLTDGTLVQIYQEDKWYGEVFVDLEDSADEFETLKPYIVSAAEKLCEMDTIVQRYSASRGDSRFSDHYDVAYVCLDKPDGIRLTYYGTCVNTMFDVCFQCENNKLILKSCGLVKNIPPDWESQFTP